MAKLGTRIVENMRIKLTNFHARFEDDGRGVGHPLAAGFVLSELSVQTADANWDTADGTYMDPDGSTEARRKVLKMDGLEIYWRGVHRAELLTRRVVQGDVAIHEAFQKLDEDWFLNALDVPRVEILTSGGEVEGSDEPLSFRRVRFDSMFLPILCTILGHLMLARPFLLSFRCQFCSLLRGLVLAFPQFFG